MSAPNLLTEWARLLLASLGAAGVRDVVLSPGSRSTPFTWAALREPGLRCRTIIDERSAAFFALGQARLTGRPSLLVCTSGSAAANYFPALVEAAESATPVLVLTADRPLELQHAAAPQTIDQVKLFGGYVRAYFDLGLPDADPAMLRALPRLAAQAVLASRSPTPGPVHLNARARKPLEPVSGGGEEGERLRAEVDRLIERGPPRAAAPLVAADPSAIEEVADACRRAQRGIIVCGPAAPWQAADPAAVASLARASGFALVPEAASQQRFAAALDPDLVIDALPALLESPRFRETHEPDVVIQIGRPPTAAGWNDYLDHWRQVERWVVSHYGWPDPWSSAAGVIASPLTPAVRALTDALDEAPAARSGPRAPGSRPDDGAASRQDWLARLRYANRTAWHAVDGVLAGGFSEGLAVRTVVQALVPGAILALGNSLPIREADVFAPAAARDLIVWSQRGANGIDGLISGAAGAAAASGRPTTLLIGDVSFAHDIGGLRAARDLPAPLTIVVLNNGGGRIFERLPLAGSGPAADVGLDAWLTPPGVDFEAAARAFGLAYTRADAPDALQAALDTAGSASSTGAARVVEVVVPDGGTTSPLTEIRDRLEAELQA